MRYLIGSVLALFVAGGLATVAQEKKPPAKLTFPTKMGAVTFDHAAHLKREKNDCKVCHDKLFQQDAKAPLNFKPGMHKPAEAKKISCGACHHAGGPAFQATLPANCSKCHVKAAAKKG